MNVHCLSQSRKSSAQCLCNDNGEIMRKTLTCPKCSHRKFWFIEGFALDACVYTGNTVTGVGPQWKMDVYSCASCGYTEWYSKAFDYELARRYVGERVRLISGIVEEGPYGRSRSSDASPE